MRADTIRVFSPATGEERDIDPNFHVVAVATQLTVAAGMAMPANLPAQIDLDDEVNSRYGEAAERSEGRRRGPLPLHDEEGHHIADAWQRWCYVVVP